MKEARATLVYSCVKLAWNGMMMGRLGMDINIPYYHFSTCTTATTPLEVVTVTMKRKNGKGRERAVKRVVVQKYYFA